jgi:hypothetical protein
MAKAGRKRKTSAPRTPSGQISRAGQREHGLPESLYVITAHASGAVKVGFSKSPSWRATTIQTGIPDTVSVSRVWRLGRENALRLEREFHRIMRQTNLHISGEWYAMDAERAEDFIRRIAASIGIDLERTAA